MIVTGYLLPACFICNAKFNKGAQRRLFGGRYVELCITLGRYMGARMSEDQKLVDAVMERAHEINGAKKLACAEAFELARRFQVKVIEIGRICNRHNIQIRKCQLGCFP